MARTARNSEPLELLVRRLARLESDCAQRAASEARVAELVEQMKLKVQQFERQNAANMRSAEDELSRLSDDLQRSLHAQHTLESRVNTGERRVMELRRSVEEVSAERDAAAAQHRAQVNERLQLERQTAEEHELREAMSRKLRDADSDAAKLRADLIRCDRERVSLDVELQKLQPKVEKLQKLEPLEATMSSRRQERSLAKAWASLRSYCQRSRRAREVCLSTVGKAKQRAYIRSVFEAWCAASSASMRRRRLSGIVMAQRRCLACRSTFRQLQAASTARQVRVQQLHRAVSHRCQRLRFCAFKALLPYPRRLTPSPASGSLETRMSTLLRQHTLRKAFAALRQPAQQATQMRLGLSTWAQSLRERSTATVLLGWRAVLAWQRCLAKCNRQFRRLRLQAAMSRLSMWAWSRRRTTAAQAVPFQQGIAEIRAQRRLHWWRETALRCRQMRSRGATVARRKHFTLLRFALGQWSLSLRVAMSRTCEELSVQIEEASQEAAEMEARRIKNVEDQQQAELARRDLAVEVQQKAAEAEGMRVRTQKMKQANMDLLSELRQAKEEGDQLRCELERWQVQRAQFFEENQSQSSVELQLEEALEMHGTLRFALRNAEMEAERATRGKATAESRLQSLQERLTDARRSYVQAISALDGKASQLAWEGREARREAERIEQVIEGIAFRMQICDQELQSMSN
mmetsp:Transcript_63133/g.150509  ORF Transcript_63133/g.150509 Transcript_63133/m.150509 type:complete len:691 (-) Transcript_63133:7-2079(-)